MERSKAFYGGLLGIRLEGDEHWAETTFSDGVRFALHEWHESVPEPSSGSVVVDFEVADIDAAAERLRSAGVEVGEVSRQDFGCFAEFRDPDGYRLQLFQPPTG